MAKERIGIMGGTFDPIHAGHISMALNAKQQARLDRVLVIPTGNPPHKTDTAPAEDRWKMVCAACGKEPALEPCRVELDRSGVIYTVDTLALLKEQYPQAAFFYIIGADTLMELQNWRSYQQVLGMCSFLVCPRTWRYTAAQLKAERQRLKAMGGDITLLDTPVVDASSTDIRAALAAGLPAVGLPAVVEEYCGAKGLYGMERRIPQADAWLDKLFAALSPERFTHTLGVASAARELALLHRLNAQKAETAGLLHDCAKCIPMADMRRLALERRLLADESLLESSNLLHAPVGAYLARVDYGISDPEVIQAILYHTTGTPGMSRLDMAVYLADKIEPTRKDYPTLSAVRALARQSLERALRLSLEGTIRHVKKGGNSQHPATGETLSWLCTLPQAND